MVTQFYLGVLIWAVYATTVANAGILQTDMHAELCQPYAQLLAVSSTETDTIRMCLQISR